MGEWEIMETYLEQKSKAYLRYEKPTTHNLELGGELHPTSHFHHSTKYAREVNMGQERVMLLGPSKFPPVPDPSKSCPGWGNSGAVHKTMLR